MSAECGQCPAGSPASLPSLHNCFSWLAAGAGLQRASWPAPHTSWPRRTQSPTDTFPFKWISANNSVHSNVVAMTVLSARRQVCTLQHCTAASISLFSLGQSPSSAQCRRSFVGAEMWSQAITWQSLVNGGAAGIITCRGILNFNYIK